MKNLAIAALAVILQFVFLFSAAPTQTFAATCQVDSFNTSDGRTVGTYCSVGCGENQVMSGYEGCGPSFSCCASTGISCEGGCVYGRRTYCSGEGGGNPIAPAPIGGCGAGRVCFIGAAESSCPQVAPPAGNLCGINLDSTTGTSTFCSNVCGLGSQPSSNSPSTCAIGGCCANIGNKCEGCQYGRKLYCAGASTNGDPVAVGKECTAGATCFIGDYDAICPDQPEPTTNICGVTPSGSLQTYCSVSCGSNPIASGYENCASGSFCCIGTSLAESRSFLSTDFKICEQIPESLDRNACTSCLSGGGIWTAIGCISANPQSMIASLIQIALGISGGVAIVMILASGFLFATSSGDTTKLKQAKEWLTSAIVGLLFIIFSVTILQFIGVTLLQIPGFGGP
ncbi:MAG: pilin [bacterium]|nr:pilin [bacterium]